MRDIGGLRFSGAAPARIRAAPRSRSARAALARLVAGDLVVHVRGHELHLLATRAARSSSRAISPPPPMPVLSVAVGEMKAATGASRFESRAGARPRWRRARRTPVDTGRQRLAAARASDRRCPAWRSRGPESNAYASPMPTAVPPMLTSVRAGSSREASHLLGRRRVITDRVLGSRAPRVADAARAPGWPRLFTRASDLPRAGFTPPARRPGRSGG